MSRRHFSPPVTDTYTELCGATAAHYANYGRCKLTRAKRNAVSAATASTTTETTKRQTRTLMMAGHRFVIHSGGRKEKAEAGGENEEDVEAENDEEVRAIAVEQERVALSIVRTLEEMEDVIAAQTGLYWRCCAASNDVSTDGGATTGSSATNVGGGGGGGLDAGSSDGSYLLAIAPAATATMAATTSPSSSSSNINHRNSSSIVSPNRNTNNANNANNNNNARRKAQQQRLHQHSTLPTSVIGPDIHGGIVASDFSSASPQLQLLTSEQVHAIIDSALQMSRTRKLQGLSSPKAIALTAAAATAAAGANTLLLPQYYKRVMSHHQNLVFEPNDQFQRLVEGRCLSSLLHQAPGLLADNVLLLERTRKPRTEKSNSPHQASPLHSMSLQVAREEATRILQADEEEREEVRMALEGMREDLVPSLLLSRASQQQQQQQQAQHRQHASSNTDENRKNNNNDKDTATVATATTVDDASIDRQKSKGNDDATWEGLLESTLKDLTREAEKTVADFFPHIVLTAAHEQQQQTQQQQRQQYFGMEVSSPTSQLLSQDNASSKSGAFFVGDDEMPDAGGNYLFEDENSSFGQQPQGSTSSSFVAVGSPTSALRSLQRQQQSNTTNNNARTRQQQQQTVLTAAEALQVSTLLLPRVAWRQDANTRDRSSETTRTRRRRAKRGSRVIFDDDDDDDDDVVVFSDGGEGEDHQNSDDDDDDDQEEEEDAQNNGAHPNTSSYLGTMRGNDFKSSLFASFLDGSSTIQSGSFILQIWTDRSIAKQHVERVARVWQFTVHAYAQDASTERAKRVMSMLVGGGTTTTNATAAAAASGAEQQEEQLQLLSVFAPWSTIVVHGGITFTVTTTIPLHPSSAEPHIASPVGFGGTAAAAATSPVQAANAAQQQQQREKRREESLPTSTVAGLANTACSCVMTDFFPISDDNTTAPNKASTCSSACCCAVSGSCAVHATLRLLAQHLAASLTWYPSFVLTTTPTAAAAAAAAAGSHSNNSNTKKGRSGKQHSNDNSSQQQQQQQQHGYYKPIRLVGLAIQYVVGLDSRLYVLSVAPTYGLNRPRIRDFSRRFVAERRAHAEAVRAQRREHIEREKALPPRRKTTAGLSEAEASRVATLTALMHATAAQWLDDEQQHGGAPPPVGMRALAKQLDTVLVCQPPESSTSISSSNSNITTIASRAAIETQRQQQQRGTTKQEMNETAQDDDDGTKNNATSLQRGTFQSSSSSRAARITQLKAERHAKAHSRDNQQALTHQLFTLSRRIHAVINAPLHEAFPALFKQHCRTLGGRGVVLRAMFIRAIRDIFEQFVHRHYVQNCGLFSAVEIYDRCCRQFVSELQNSKPLWERCIVPYCLFRFELFEDPEVTLQREELANLKRVQAQRQQQQQQQQQQRRRGGDGEKIQHEQQQQPDEEEGAKGSAVGKPFAPKPALPSFHPTTQEQQQQQQQQQQQRKPLEVTASVASLSDFFRDKYGITYNDSYIVYGVLKKLGIVYTAQTIEVPAPSTTTTRAPATVVHSSPTSPTTQRNNTTNNNNNNKVVKVQKISYASRFVPVGRHKTMLQIAGKQQQQQAVRHTRDDKDSSGSGSNSDEEEDDDGGRNSDDDLLEAAVVSGKKPPPGAFEQQPEQLSAQQQQQLSMVQKVLLQTAPDTAACEKIPMLWIHHAMLRPMAMTSYFATREQQKQKQQQQQQQQGQQQQQQQQGLYHSSLEHAARAQRLLSLMLSTTTLQELVSVLRGRKKKDQQGRASSSGGITEEEQEKEKEEEKNSDIVPPWLKAMIFDAAQCFLLAGMAAPPPASSSSPTGSSLPAPASGVAARHLTYSRVSALHILQWLGALAGQLASTAVVPLLAEVNALCVCLCALYGLQCASSGEQVAVSSSHDGNGNGGGGSSAGAKGIVNSTKNAKKKKDNNTNTNTNTQFKIVAVYFQKLLQRFHNSILSFLLLMHIYYLMVRAVIETEVKVSLFLQQQQQQIKSPLRGGSSSSSASAAFSPLGGQFATVVESGASSFQQQQLQAAAASRSDEENVYFEPLHAGMNVNRATRAALAASYANTILHSLPTQYLLSVAQEASNCLGMLLSPQAEKMFEESEEVSKGIDQHTASFALPKRDNMTEKGMKTSEEDDSTSTDTPEDEEEEEEEESEKEEEEEHHHQQQEQQDGKPPTPSPSPSFAPSSSSQPSCRRVDSLFTAPSLRIGVSTLTHSFIALLEGSGSEGGIREQVRLGRMIDAHIVFNQAAEEFLLLEKEKEAEKKKKAWSSYDEQEEDFFVQRVSQNFFDLRARYFPVLVSILVRCAVQMKQLQKKARFSGVGILTPGLSDVAARHFFRVCAKSSVNRHRHYLRFVLPAMLGLQDDGTERKKKGLGGDKGTNKKTPLLLAKQRRATLLAADKNVGAQEEEEGGEASGQQQQQQAQQKPAPVVIASFGKLQGWALTSVHEAVATYLDNLHVCTRKDVTPNNNPSLRAATFNKGKPIFDPPPTTASASANHQSLAAASATTTTTTTRTNFFPTSTMSSQRTFATITDLIKWKKKAASTAAAARGGNGSGEASSATTTGNNILALERTTSSTVFDTRSLVKPDTTAAAKSVVSSSSSTLHVPVALSVDIHIYADALQSIRDLVDIVKANMHLGRNAAAVDSIEKEISVVFRDIDLFFREFIVVGPDRDRVLATQVVEDNSSAEPSSPQLADAEGKEGQHKQRQKHNRICVLLLSTTNCTLPESEIDATNNFLRECRSAMSQVLKMKSTIQSRMEKVAAKMMHELIQRFLLRRRGAARVAAAADLLQRVANGYRTRRYMHFRKVHIYFRSAFICDLMRGLRERRGLGLAWSAKIKVAKMTKRLRFANKVQRFCSGYLTRKHVPEFKQLRRTEAAKSIQRVGRGYLARLAPRLAHEFHARQQEVAYAVRMMQRVGCAFQTRQACYWKLFFIKEKKRRQSARQVQKIGRGFASRIALYRQLAAARYAERRRKLEWAQGSLCRVVAGYAARRLLVAPRWSRFKRALLQRLGWGYLLRLALATRHQERQHAAQTLQSVGRGHFGRCEVRRAVLDKRQRVHRSLQRFCVGFSARQELFALWKQRRLRRVLLLQRMLRRVRAGYAARSHLCATVYIPNVVRRLQRVGRGAVCRWKQLSFLRAVALEQQRLQRIRCAASRTLQRAGRGFAARSQIMFALRVEAYRCSKESEEHKQRQGTWAIAAQRVGRAFFNARQVLGIAHHRRLRSLRTAQIVGRAWLARKHIGKSCWEQQQRVRRARDAICSHGDPESPETLRALRDQHEDLQKELKELNWRLDDMLTGDAFPVGKGQRLTPFAAMEKRNKTLQKENKKLRAQQSFPVERMTSASEDANGHADSPAAAGDVSLRLDRLGLRLRKVDANLSETQAQHQRLAEEDQQLREQKHGQRKLDANQNEIDRLTREFSLFSTRNNEELEECLARRDAVNSEVARGTEAVARLTEKAQDTSEILRHRHRNNTTSPDEHHQQREEEGEESPTDEEKLDALLAVESLKKDLESMKARQSDEVAELEEELRKLEESGM